MTSSSSPADAIQAVFRDFPDPESGRGLDTFDQVHEVRFDARGWR